VVKLTNPIEQTSLKKLIVVQLLKKSLYEGVSKSFRSESITK